MENGTRYFYVCDKNLPEFYVCGNLISEGGFVHCRRRFDCNVLIFVLEGTLPITQSERRLAVSEGQYVFLKAGEEHYGHRAAEGRLSYMWVHFGSGTGWETGGGDALPGSFSYLLPECGTAENLRRVGLLFHQLLDYSRQEGLYRRELLSCSLSLLLMELTQEALDGGKKAKPAASPVVFAAAEWIKSNCHRQLSVSEIAEAVHYNAEYLSALFKKETGLTLIRYLNRTRIDVAKRLLLSGSISIKEAAYSCGFADEKYFMKLFKRLEGMTPLEYKSAFYKK